MNRQPLSTSCPCGSGKHYNSCCGPVIDGMQPAETAEALMRSRYTAFTLQNQVYLLKSWHPSTRPETVEFNHEIKWLRLKILHTGENTVEFVATFRIHGKAHKLHENSLFTQENGEWFYVKGEQRQA